jgi:hypothetical protein
VRDHQMDGIAATEGPAGIRLSSHVSDDRVQVRTVDRNIEVPPAFGARSTMKPRPHIRN